MAVKLQGVVNNYYSKVLGSAVAGKYMNERKEAAIDKRATDLRDKYSALNKYTKDKWGGIIFDERYDPDDAIDQINLKNDIRDNLESEENKYEDDLKTVNDMKKLEKEKPEGFKAAIDEFSGKDIVKSNEFMDYVINYTAGTPQTADRQTAIKTKATNTKNITKNYGAIYDKKTSKANVTPFIPGGKK